MIILDEHLLGREVAEAIAYWWRGSVRNIVDLRPGTLIKDDAIPALLHRERQPTFVTINVRDFWKRTPADNRYCVLYRTVVSMKSLGFFVVYSVLMSFGPKQLGWEKLLWSAVNKFNIIKSQIANSIRCLCLEGRHSKRWICMLRS